MTFKEFNKRCNEVFESREGDEYYRIKEVFPDKQISISMSEIDCGERIYFDYKPDMSERPEALAYLLGQRDDFND